MHRMFVLYNINLQKTEMEDIMSIKGTITIQHLLQSAEDDAANDPKDAVQTTRP